MSGVASERICETCAYCSFAGNCDRYDKPLTSIEQPACDAYEIHPWLDENRKLRERVEELEELLPENGRWFSAEVVEAYVAEIKKLRELLRQALACIEQGEDEYGSDWSCAGCEFCDMCDGLIQMRATAQELGVTCE